MTEQRTGQTCASAWAAMRACSLAALLSTGGCLTTGREQDRFVADVGPLDFMQFLYVQAPAGPGEAPKATRLELSGSGHMQMSTGASRRVQDPFWTERDSAAWDDMRTDQLVLPAERTRAFFQEVVDAGFYDSEAPGALESVPETAPEKLVILARIGSRRKVLQTQAPVFMDIFRRLMSEL